MNILALIPARGGSKSIPRKNIQPFAGHPLVAYSIAAGLQAETVNRVIVSTDDEEIAEISRTYRAETPFLRPAKFAQDDTTDLPVFLHALKWLKEQEGYQPDIVIQLRPTSPIRPPDLVDRAARVLVDHPHADSVRGVVPSGQNPHKMWRIDEQGHMRPLITVPDIPEPYNAPRQSLPPTYWQTGHIDAIRTSIITEKNSLSGEIILPVELDIRYTVDIDTLKDWQRAEWLIHQGELEMVYPGRIQRSLPKQVALLVLDFDGVMTDNRVWVDQNGRELVAAYRSDSLGINRLRNAGVDIVVLSTETNPVVAARCRKLNLPVYQGIKDKGKALNALFVDLETDPSQVVYVGNDINDLPCFPLVGWAVVVANAEPEVRQHADFILSRDGGHGAVREICDLLHDYITRSSS
jgi:N-acylneuraminate cytidylyltransferase